MHANHTETHFDEVAKHRIIYQCNKADPEYGVAFHACGNSMKSLGWTEKELLPFARVVPIGVDDIMQLQESGFAYISW